GMTTLTKPQTDQVLAAARGKWQAGVGFRPKTLAHTVLGRVPRAVEVRIVIELLEAHDLYGSDAEGMLYTKIADAGIDAVLDLLDGGQNIDGNLQTVYLQAINTGLQGIGATLLANTTTIDQMPARYVLLLQGALEVLGLLTVSDEEDDSLIQDVLRAAR